MKRFICSLGVCNTQIKALLTLMLLACIGIQTVRAADSDALITTWKTDNTGASSDTQITIPMISGYWTVDWGDGTSQNGLLNAVTHTYAVAGTYTVKIWVGFARINFKDSGDKAKILSIDQWGTSGWGNGSTPVSMSSAFANLPNLQILATDTPNFSLVNNMSVMFARSPLANPLTTNWNTSAVTDMSSMFSGATSANPDVSNWNTTLVTDMSSMFKDIATDPDVSQLYTGKVTDMEGMFEGSTSANPDVTNWDTGKLTRASRMFKDATSFDRDLGAWNVGALNRTGEMFTNTGLSTANYDKLLIGWGSQTLQNYVYLWVGNTVYCSDEATAARDHMMDTYNWVFYDGGRCPLPPDDPVTAPVMTAGSDSGSSDTDNVTNIDMPGFDVACAKSGNTITLYTDNPAADTAVGTWTCTAAGTETATVSSALADGTQNISYTDKNTAGETAHSPSLEVTIDTLAPSQPACSTVPSPVIDGATATTSCTAVEEFAVLTIPDMQCEPSPADDTGIVECIGIVGQGDGEISKSDDFVTVTDLAGNFNSDETTGLVRDTTFSNGFE